MIENDDGTITIKKGSGIHRVFDYQKERLVNEYKDMEDNDLPPEERIGRLVQAAARVRRYEARNE
jgi:hypothetical protein